MIKKNRIQRVGIDTSIMYVTFVRADAQGYNARVYRLLTFRRAQMLQRALNATGYNVIEPVLTHEGAILGYLKTDIAQALQEYAKLHAELK